MEEVRNFFIEIVKNDMKAKYFILIVIIFAVSGSAFFVTGSHWGDINKAGNFGSNWKGGSLGITFGSGSVIGGKSSYTGTSEPVYIFKHKK